MQPIVVRSGLGQWNSSAAVRAVKAQALVTERESNGTESKQENAGVGVCQEEQELSRNPLREI